MAKDTEGTPLDRNKRLLSLEKLAKENPAFRPASQVLTVVKAVPTVFPSYDLATGVRGHAIERAAVIHGESNHGKTTFALGLGKSFLARDFMFKYVDAELVTPLDYVKKILGPYANHPGFSASRPKSYEEIQAEVRDYVTTIARLRDEGDLAEDMTALVVIDSLDKLTPKDFFKRVAAEGKQASKKKGGDGWGGRGGMIKAGLNAAWLQELVPLLYHTRTALAFIVRESEDPSATAQDRMYGNDYKVRGGKALIYDSSIVVRVELAGMIYKDKKTDDDGPKTKPTVYGERNRVVIRKTKIAGKSEKTPIAYFHTSNGLLTPPGLDPARDLLEAAQQVGTVTLKGSWYSFGHKRWQGEHGAVLALSKDPELFAELDLRTRERFPEVAAEQVG